MNVRNCTFLTTCVALFALLAGGCAGETTDELGDQQTFFVRTDGDDASEGSEDAPWKSVQYGTNQLEPGDTLVLGGGVYSEQLIVGRSGDAAEGPITIKSQDGETAVLDGTDLQVQRGFSALVQIRSQSFVRIEGLELRNFRSELGRRNPVGIFVSGQGTGIEIVDNNIHHIEALAVNAQRDGHGIAVYGTGEQPLSNILIEGNEVHHLTLGTSEALVINGNVEGFKVLGNEVHHNDNIGIDIIGFEGKSPIPELDRARDGVVAENYVHHIDTAMNPSYNERNAGGIYVDGGTRVVIEGNVLHDNNMGIEIASEHATGSTTDITVRDNVVVRNHIVGLALGGYDEKRGRTQGCVIVGNTFVGNDTDQNGNGELLFQFDVRDNTVSKNVLVAGDQGLFLGNPYVENTGNQFSDNQYFTGSEPRWEWRTEGFSSIADFVVATGGDAGSVFEDPLFADFEASDFRVADSNRGASEATLLRARDLMNS